MRTTRTDKTRSRRGITLVEVVVALTIIVIVSGAAIALISSHTKLEARTVQAVEAANIAENAIECFRYAKDDEAFYSVFSKTCEPTPDNGTPTTYMVKKNGATVTVKPIYSENKIVINAVYSNGDSIFEEITYVKRLNAVNSTGGGGGL